MERAATVLTLLVLTGAQPAFAAVTSTDLTATPPSPAAEMGQTTTTEPTASDDEIAPYSPGSNNLAFDFGEIALLGDLGNQYSNSLGGQIHYTYGISDIVGFDTSVGYSGHSDGKFSMATALVGLRLNLSFADRLIPYSIFGAGLYKPSFSFENALNTGLDTVSPVLLGVHAGLGLDFEMTQQMFLGGSMTFHDIFGNQEQTATSTISTGGTFLSFLVHAGYAF